MEVLVFIIILLAILGLIVWSIMFERYAEKKEMEYYKKIVKQSNKILTGEKEDE